ncbi:MAG: hypothetical protein ACRBN8_36160 [Nannocystales bacterium]
MLRAVLLLALACCGVGCRPCNERCVGGMRISLEADPVLSDGRYDVVVTLDGGTALEASCTIAERGTVATCEGSLHALGEDGSQDLNVLRLSEPASGAEHVEVEVYWNDTLRIDADVQLDQEPSESCNPHCAWASATLPL